ncbi:hydrolase [Vibrio phage D479]
MKCYVFVNTKMSGINAGIQALHAVAELSLQNDEDGNYVEWAENHKTVVLLNGGSHTDLIDVHFTLDNHCVPNGVFREVDVNNSVTAVAVVADNFVMDAIEDIKMCRQSNIIRTPEEKMNMCGGRYEFAEYLQSFRTLRG